VLTAFFGLNFKSFESAFWKEKMLLSLIAFNVPLIAIHIGSSVLRLDPLQKKDVAVGLLVGLGQVGVSLGSGVWM